MQTVTVNIHGAAAAQGVFDTLTGRSVQWTEGRAWHALTFEWVGSHYDALQYLRQMFPNYRIFCPSAKA